MMTTTTEHENAATDPELEARRAQCRQMLRDALTAVVEGDLALRKAREAREVGNANMRFAFHEWERLLGDDDDLFSLAGSGPWVHMGMIVTAVTSPGGQREYAVCPFQTV